MIGLNKEKFIDTIERYSTPVTETGCWIWDKSLNRGGYGRVKIEGKTVSAHRLSYMVHVEDPKDMYVLHKCDVACCVNPEHLYLGTHQDNMRDKKDRKRATKPRPNAQGEKHGNCLLTKENVKEIRQKYLPRQYTYKMLSKEYGVSVRTIQSIIRKERWNYDWID